MCERQVFIFLPNTIDLSKNGYLQGCYKNIESKDTYYVTSDKIASNPMEIPSHIGRVISGRKTTNLKNVPVNVDDSTKRIIIGSTSSKNHVVTSIVYDYNAFKKTVVITSGVASFGQHFQLLSENINSESSNRIKTRLRFIVHTILFLLGLFINLLKKLKAVIETSATLLHFEESLRNLRWFIKSCGHRRNMPKIGNALASKLVDIIVGIIVVNVLIVHQKFIFSWVQQVIEDIIQNLRELLSYLMGAPIGLKLNYAFNKCLGTFFFYHISLWRVFLKGIQPVFVEHFNYLILPGLFGFSFQIAMCSDIIAIATFHVYCIYVYAARLFHLQIKGIVSLWRLFIGRKFNPLRQRVDSCDYSQNQLFIGTLGFTVLLFLLPTTTMYYTVFTIFRLIILAVDGILLKCRYFLTRLPFYVVTLWLFNSSSIAGTVYLKWRKSNEEKQVQLEAKLFALPLITCMKNFVPYDYSLPATNNNSLSHVFHCVFTGLVL